jgi:hypothetical protein
VIVLSDGIAIEGVNNMVCPTTFQSKLGRARYKARVLEFFESEMPLTDCDWVLHMDEETTMDALSFKACFDFIRFVSNTCPSSAVTIAAAYEHHLSFEYS